MRERDDFLRLVEDRFRPYLESVNYNEVFRLNRLLRRPYGHRPDLESLDEKTEEDMDVPPVILADWVRGVVAAVKAVRFLEESGFFRLIEELSSVPVPSAGTAVDGPRPSLMEWTEADLPRMDLDIVTKDELHFVLSDPKPGEIQWICGQRGSWLNNFPDDAEFGGHVGVDVVTPGNWPDRIKPTQRHLAKRLVLRSCYGRIAVGSVLGVGNLSLGVLGIFGSIPSAGMSASNTAGVVSASAAIFASMMTGMTTAMSALRELGEEIRK